MIFSDCVYTILQLTLSYCKSGGAFLSERSSLKRSILSGKSSLRSTCPL